MFRYKCLPIFALLIHGIACDTFKCGPDLGPNCACYTPTSDTAETSQLVCTDTTADKLESINLFNVGAKITGDCGLLYIYNTEKLTEILKSTFNGVTFKKIFIEHNSVLTKIDKNAFKVSARTETLAVRSNPTLKRSGLFDIALALSNNLTDVEFQENLIENFDNAFNDAKFKNLVSIRLDGQKFDTETINLNTKSFGNLPKLRQLSLNNKKLQVVKAENQAVIDLYATLPTGRVLIFLRQSQLKTVEGLLANINKNSVALDLENNNLEAIPKVCEEIANNKGRCYLEGIKDYITCKCNDVQIFKKILLDATLKSFIWGLSDVTCEGKKITADDCTATTTGS